MRLLQASFGLQTAREDHRRAARKGEQISGHAVITSESLKNATSGTTASSPA